MSKPSLLEQAFRTVAANDDAVLEQHLLATPSLLTAVKYFPRQPVQFSQEFTLLQYAVDHQAWACARALLAHGADPLQCSENTPTAHAMMVEVMKHVFNDRRLTRDIDLERDDKIEVFLLMYAKTGIDPLAEVLPVQLRQMQDDSAANYKQHEEYRQLLKISELIATHPFAQKTRLEKEMGECNGKNGRAPKKI